LAGTSAGVTRRRLVRNAAGAAGVLVAGRIVGVDAFGRPRLPQPSERGARAGTAVAVKSADPAQLRLARALRRRRVDPDVVFRFPQAV
jgi:hypothetical protein